jgi:RimJ/RimL family protein N-acetyltransferase
MRRTAEKLGFSLEGGVAGDTALGGHMDRVVYGVLSHEWRPPAGKPGA